MSITLIAIFSAIIFVSGILIYSLLRPKKKRKGNRYSKRTAHVEPSLGENPLNEIHYDHHAECCDDHEETFFEDEHEVHAPKKLVQSLESSLITLYLMAPDNQPYNGYELLQALLSAGLRYGKMHIFHRHEQKTGRGEVLFSLASATSPGTFDLPKMGAFSCKGLVLFFDANKMAQARKTFEIMLDTAAQLAEDLGGEVLDEHREILSEEKVEEIMDTLELVEQA
jgi:cell division protein ZipA